MIPAIAPPDNLFEDDGGAAEDWSNELADADGFGTSFEVAWLAAAVANPRMEAQLLETAVSLALKRA
jgi:hypothetical protein